MKLTEIQDLIKFVARAGVTEVEIEQKDFKLTIKSEMPKGRGKKEEQVVQTIQVPAAMPQAMVQAAPVAAAAPAPAPAAAPAPAPAPAPTPAEDTSNLIEVKSPRLLSPGTWSPLSNAYFSGSLLGTVGGASVLQTLSSLEVLLLMQHVCVRRGSG